MQALLLESHNWNVGQLCKMQMYSYCLLYCREANFNISTATEPSNAKTTKACWITWQEGRYGRKSHSNEPPWWGSGKFRKVTTEILPHTPTPLIINIMPGLQVSMRAHTYSATLILTSLKQTDLLPGYKRNLNMEIILKIIICDKKKEKNDNR